MIETDVLIIGTGVAGLVLALELAAQRPDLKIVALTKSVPDQCSTRYAQGGVAAVWDQEFDGFEKHIEDTLVAGDGLCDQRIVEIVVKEGPDRIRRLIEWGTRFDKSPTGEYELGLEGGHQTKRILHHKDLSGWEIQRAILERSKATARLEILDHVFALELITQHHLGNQITRETPNVDCYGAYVLNSVSNQIETIQARMTVIASGGAGQLYRSTTNPVVATGDGIALGYRAKCRIANMEFVQFHPTALFSRSGENPDFLISEAVRGFGGVLTTQSGEEFMPRYDQRGSLAPRDVVARAIDMEMKKQGVDYMCLDCRHLDPEGFAAHFPTIHQKCVSVGIDPFKDLIPVVPACHYFCGGIAVDDHGRSSINHLYACGECSCTGLHGANRLASNSLLEAIVFANRTANDIASRIDAVGDMPMLPDWNAIGTTEPEEMVLITQSLKELKDIMSTYVGIVRSDIRLHRALDRLLILYRETEQLYASSVISPQLCELRNLISIGYLVTKSAGVRKENAGLHFNVDHAEKSSAPSNLRFGI